MIVVGRLSLALALIFALSTVLFLALGTRWDRTDFRRHGYYSVYAFFLSVLVAAAALLQAFLKQDYGFAYVADNSDSSLSTFYRIAGFWAGQQGSLLLWLLLLAVTVLAIALMDFERLERLTGGAVMVLAAIAAVFAALMVFDAGSDPFVKSAAAVQPVGLNPLLLHPAMVLHPPALFVGYVGLAVPFAFAVSTLLLGRGDGRWVRRAQKWAVAGWLFLTLGIGLGAWWAYVVLSFGGFWAWDAVENTSLVPWLTATALLHTFTVYRSRGLLKRWGLALAALTFWFTLLATWTTRTGVIRSVHAFEQRSLLVWMLSTFLVATAGLSVGLIVWRWRRFESREDVQSWLSREYLYHLANVLFSLLAVALASGTVAVPLVSRGLSSEGDGLEIVASTYDAVAKPLGVVILALLALCPLVGWRSTEWGELRRALILPLVSAAVSAVLWVSLGFQSNAWGFVGLLVCGFAFGAVLEFMLRAARRAAGPGKSLWSGLGRAFTGSRTRTAAYVVHLGMVLLVAGLLGSTVYKTEQASAVQVTRGTTAGVNDYTLVFRGLSGSAGAQGSVRAFAHFDVVAGGATIGQVAPHTDIYPVSGAAVRAVILGRPFEDLFVVADEPFDGTSTTIRLRLMVFPLIRWVWIGALLLCAGAAISLWPARARADRRALAAGGAGDGGDA